MWSIIEFNYCLHLELPWFDIQQQCQILIPKRLKSTTWTNMLSFWVAVLLYSFRFSTTQLISLSLSYAFPLQVIFAFPHLLFKSSDFQHSILLIGYWYHIFAYPQTIFIDSLALFSQNLRLSSLFLYIFFSNSITQGIPLIHQSIRLSDTSIFLLRSFLKARVLMYIVALI